MTQTTTMAWSLTYSQISWSVKSRGIRKHYSWVALVVKNLHTNAGDVRDPYILVGFDPQVGKIPWRRAQQPTPVFLPGESLG